MTDHYRDIAQELTLNLAKAQSTIQDLEAQLAAQRARLAQVEAENEKLQEHVRAMASDEQE